MSNEKLKQYVEFMSIHPEFQTYGADLEESLNNSLGTPMISSLVDAMSYQKEVLEVNGDDLLKLVTDARANIFLTRTVMEVGRSQALALHAMLYHCPTRPA